MTARAQSNVIGVAVLLGVTVVALAAVTASVGTLVETNAAAADANRVAADLDDAVQPVRTTGVRVGTVAFTDGSLRTVERSLRVLNASGVVLERASDALLFESGSYAVTALGGAVVTGHADGGRFVRRPPVTAGDGVLVLGIPVVEAEIGVRGERTRIRLRTRVTHDRRSLGPGTYRLAVETERPGPWRAYFDRVNATPLPGRDFDGDGVSSVVARFPGTRTAYVVVHRVEVSTDG